MVGYASRSNAVEGAGVTGQRHGSGLTARGNQSTLRRDGPAHDSVRRLSNVATIALLTLLLGGCTRVSFSSHFREDGSAAHVLQIVFERERIQPADLPTVERELVAAEARAREDGFTPTPIESATQIGLHVTGETRDAVDAGAALNNLFSSIVVESDDGPIAPFAGTFEKRGEAVGGTAYDLEMTVDGSVLVRAVQQFARGSTPLSAAPEVAAAVSFSYRVIMPGELKDTNGEQAGPSSVTWEISQTGLTTMKASSTVGKDTPWVFVGIVTFASLAIAASIGRGTMEVLLRRRQRTSLPGYTDPLVAGHPAPLTTIADIRVALVQLLQRVVAGFPLASRATDERSRDRGTDPERD
jgi:hypothetical protein